MEEAIKADEILVVVQVNGKVRSKIEVAVGTDGKQIENVALADERIVARLQGRTIKKVIVVKNKLVNIVV
jgi:leucyl-tRNA synthetase